MTASLKLSRNLELPHDAQTQTFGILAKRGSGKTYAALVLAEELLGAGLRTVIADPVGVCWGLRSNAAGTGPGLPVLVLGGDHGDLPLEETAGEQVADLVVDEGLSAVLDLSLLRKRAQVRFMTDFAERIYHRNRDPLHLILDEADAFAPQRAMRGQKRMLGAVEDLVRRGRARGIGITLVTQRSAVLNKDVLTQIEALFAFRTTSPQDRKAIDEWVKAHGDEGNRQKLLADLASLPIGTAWFWSPGWLQTFQRVKIRKRQTFDSSATPTAGRRARPPKNLAEIDMGAVRDKMAAAVERAKGDDPKHLRKRIRELEGQVAKLERQVAAAKADAENRPAEVVEVPVAADELVEKVAAAASQLGEVLATAQSLRASELERVQCQQRPTPKPVTRRTVPASPGAPRREPSMGSGSLPPARQKILDALAFLEGIGVGEADRVQLAFLAGQSPKSSGYANNLGALRTAGMIDYPSGGKVALTEDGRVSAEPRDTPQTSADLHAVLERELPPARWRIVEAAIAVYPGCLDRAALAEQVGASPASSGFANNLGALRSLGLIEYPGRGLVAAASVLFLEG